MYYLDDLSIHWKPCKAIKKPHLHSLLKTHLSYIPGDLVSLILSYHDVVLVRFTIPPEENIRYDYLDYDFNDLPEYEEVTFLEKIMDRTKWNFLYQKIQEKKMYYEGRYINIIPHEKLLTSIEISNHPNDITTFLIEYPRGIHRYRGDNSFDIFMNLLEP